MMKLLPPGSVIGMLGGGQLGRMSIMAGRHMGYRFVVLDPSPHACAAGVADEHIVADFDDLMALRQLAGKVDRVTLEFENIPGASLAELEPLVKVYPNRVALEICQNRLREKQFLHKSGLPCAPFARVASAAELAAAVEQIGRPGILKTADFGYDGKGQIRIGAGDDLDKVWDSFAEATAVYEGWVNFSAEYSVICARSIDGRMSVYPLFENTHCRHILHTTVTPAGVGENLEAEARALACEIAESLALVGVIAVELFLTDSGWVVNEMAPRPHNSGHVTLDAHHSSQFEQHIRMVCGLTPGSCRPHQAAAMLNLIGDNVADFSLLAQCLADERCKLHLYDKGAARPGRKMGHLTFLGDNAEDCRERAERAARLLRAGPYASELPYE